MELQHLREVPKHHFSVAHKSLGSPKRHTVARVITRSSLGEFALQTRSVALTLDPTLFAPRLTPRAMIGTTQQFPNHDISDRHPIDKKSPQRAAVLINATAFDSDKSGAEQH
jgi:hypothetical protein